MSKILPSNICVLNVGAAVVLECYPAALLPCRTARGHPEQLDAGGAALEDTKSLLCSEGWCMCW